ncbi:MAG: NrfD/PsrC family molybdoenzyme membrane anchor subunit [Anaerolineales bacterium]
MTTYTKKLPYGVWDFTRGWVFLAIALLALIALGIYAYSIQLIEGEVVTGMRNLGTMGGATWGLYISFLIYFIGLSFTGISIAAMIRLLGLEKIKPIARMAEALTVIALILGALVVIVDLGQPARALVNLFRYARPGSPFFGTFTLVIAGYLFASQVYLYLDGRRDAAILAKIPGKLQGFFRIWSAGYKDTPAEQERHHQTSFWLAIAIVPLLITAHSTLGFVFGLQVGRPGWFSSLQAPEFVALAGVSGIGFLIIIAAILRKVLNTEEILDIDVFKWLSDFLMVLIVVYLYFLVVEWLTITYTAQSHELIIANAMYTGDYAWAYWLTVAALVIPLLLLGWQFIFKRYQMAWIVISGFLVNVAAIVKRYLIVVPSQTHGKLLPYEIGSYTPTWIEYSVVLGLFALGTLLYISFIKIFPIMEVIEIVEGGE